VDYGTEAEQIILHHMQEVLDHPYEKPGRQIEGAIEKTAVK
jgi:hypothetical protein